MLTRTVCSIALATLPIFHAVDCAASEIGDVHARRSKVEQHVPDLELAAGPQHGIPLTCNSAQRRSPWPASGCAG